jgi:hypothetical protein
MTPSNSFRFESGAGTAALRVSGGSASARRWGIVALAAGVPVALGGLAMLAYGNLKDRDALKLSGIAGLAVGGVMVGVSLPLLGAGTTKVRNAKGSVIALTIPSPSWL